MIDKFKQLWLRALRGGKFKQTTGVLRRDNNSCCCLGVLCDIIDPSGWNASPINGRYGHVAGEKRLSSDFLNKVGLTQDQQSALIKKNDTYGVSFAEIADYIEEYI